MNPGDRVRGRAGVFYTDQAAEGIVLNLVAPDCVHVQLDNGDRAVVPINSVTPYHYNPRLSSGIGQPIEVEVDLPDNPSSDEVFAAMREAANLLGFDE